MNRIEIRAQVPSPMEACSRRRAGRVPRQAFTRSNSRLSDMASAEKNCRRTIEARPAFRQQESGPSRARVDLRRLFPETLDVDPNQLEEDWPEDHHQYRPARSCLDLPWGVAVNDKSQCRVGEIGCVEAGKARPGGSDVASAHEQKYGAGDHDAEAQAQDRQALPFAGSGKMQQKWRLDRDGAGNRQAGSAPEQAPSNRRRELC